MNNCTCTLVIVLRDLRRDCGSQMEFARASGVHLKTISSFETGARTDALKISQLKKFCDAAGVTLAEFFQRLERAEFEHHDARKLRSYDRKRTPFSGREA